MAMAFPMNRINAPIEPAGRSSTVACHRVGIQMVMGTGYWISLTAAIAKQALLKTWGVPCLRIAIATASLTIKITARSVSDRLPTMAVR